MRISQLITVSLLTVLLLIMGSVPFSMASHSVDHQHSAHTPTIGIYAWNVHGRPNDIHRHANPLANHFPYRNTTILTISFDTSSSSVFPPQQNTSDLPVLRAGLIPTLGSTSQTAPCAQGWTGWLRPEHLSAYRHQQSLAQLRFFIPMSFPSVAVIFWILDQQNSIYWHRKIECI